VAERQTGRWRKKRSKGSILETADGLICWLMSWQVRITEGLDSCQTVALARV